MNYESTEEEIKDLQEAVDRLIEVGKKDARLLVNLYHRLEHFRKALEIYGDGNNWEFVENANDGLGGYVFTYCSTFSCCLAEPGRLARLALAEEEWERKDKDD
jgi:hypothetical protein